MHYRSTTKAGVSFPLMRSKGLPMAPISELGRLDCSVLAVHSLPVTSFHPLPICLFQCPNIPRGCGTCSLGHNHLYSWSSGT